MRYLGRHLRRAGLETQLFGYNTVTASLESCARGLADFVAARDTPVVLVGHSLGGLVSLAAAQHIPEEQLAGVVMLGSPYQGAKAGRILRSLTGGPFSRIGRPMHDWNALPSKHTAPAPVFTLAGTRSLGLGRMICRFHEPSDGTVTLAETQYPGATARSLPVSHTGMLLNRAAAHQVTHWVESLRTASPGRPRKGSTLLAES